MTENEAVEWIKKIYIDTNQSDRCISLKIAISALMEIQKYRAIGTVEEIKRMQKYSALAKKHDTIGKVIEACAEYEEIGSVEEFSSALKNVKTLSRMYEKLNNQEVSEYHKLNQYEAIGTIEECREARRKQEPIRPITYQGTNRADCPVCGATVRGIKDHFGDWCSKCGKHLDWEME